MSRFFVGQRVKFIGQGRPFKNPLTATLVGYTGKIEARSSVPGCDWSVRLDAGIYDIDAAADCLVPIVDPGQVAVTLEQLLSVPGLESLEKILGVKA